MRSIRSKLSMTAVALLATFSLAASAGRGVAPGQPAPQFSLQDQDGKDVSLKDFTGKVVVLEWTNPDCPFVQRHYQEKTMLTLADEYKPKGVAWLAINSSHTITTEANKQWATQQGLDYPILNDASGTVGHLYGARNTPHMFVIDKAGTVAYTGAIDNDPDGDKGASRVNYVKKALDEILADKPVSQPQTKPYGCSVKYAR